MVSLNPITERVFSHLSDNHSGMPKSAYCSALVVNQFDSRQFSTSLPSTDGKSIIERSFFAASLTKSFTAATVIRTLRSRGVSEWEPVSKWIPEFKTLLDEISFVELLNHTAGLSDYVENAQLMNIMTDDLDLEHATLKVLKETDRKSPSVYKYSNTGYLAAGLALQRLADDEFESLFQLSVALPAGLLGSHYFDCLHASNSPALWQNGTEWKQIPPSRYAIGWTDGAIVTTLRDLVQWAGFIEKSAPDDLRKTASPRAVYHLGMNWEHSSVFGRCFWHSGAGPGIRSLLLGSIDTGETLALLMNYECENGFDPVDAILDQVFFAVS